MRDKADSALPTPTAASWPDVHRLPAPIWRAALRRFATLDLAEDGWERLPGGEDSIVLARADVVVKLVPPFLARDAEREMAVLPRLELPVATPRLEGVATVEGWTALRMSRLPGLPGDQAWPELDGAARIAVMERLGEVLAALWRTPTIASDGDAPSMMARLRARAQRHAASGIDVDGFLDRHLPADEPPVLVHFDLNTGNAMLDGARVAGILDFVASRCFYAPFDLVAPAVFFVRGDAALLGALVRASGLGERSPEELAAWHLLHPFSDLARDVGMAGRGLGSDPLGALVDLWRPRP